MLMLPSWAAEPCRKVFRQSQNLFIGSDHSQRDHWPLDHRWMMAIFEQAGFCLVTDSKPSASARLLQRIEFGESDVMSGASKTLERERYAWFTIAYRDEAIRFYVHQSRRKELNWIKDLSGVIDAELTIVSMRSSFHGPEFEARRPELLKRDKLIEISADEQYYSLLRLRRADVAVASDQLAQMLPRAAPDVQYLETPLYSAPVHLMLSRKTVSEEDIAQLNAAIRVLQKKAAFDDRMTPAIKSSAQ